MSQDDKGGREPGEFESSGPGCVLLCHLETFVRVVSSLTADAADPLGALELFVTCFLANAAGNLTVFFLDVVALPAEISPLLDLCFFPIVLRFSPNRSLFPRLEPEATRAMSEDFDLTFLERSNLVRSSPMSPSMVSGSFSRLIICRHRSRCLGFETREK